MRSALFSYDLPPERIAQQPVEPRDASRLLVLSAAAGVRHHRFSDLPDLLEPGDLLVVNDTRVLPARLLGRKATGARVEILLLRRLAATAVAGVQEWEALVQPGRKLPPGSVVELDGGGCTARVGERREGGARHVRLETGDGTSPDTWIHRHGVMPLPPYIRAGLPVPERYQTVYSREPASAAAPTAGLHFTPELFTRLKARGVEVATVTLHVGIATFRPIRSEDIESHEMHEESYDVPPATAEAIRRCGGRVVVVGTTTLRCLESAARVALGGATGPRRQVAEGPGVTRLFLRPGDAFLTADLLITNFHQPLSSLLVLVSAFAGRERILDAYRVALDEGYRFLSFGDAMLLERPPSPV